MTAPAPDPALARTRSRQRTTLLTLAVILIGGGLLILLVLDRIPPPLRIIAGLSDIIAGLILLVLVRQKFKRP